MTFSILAHDREAGAIGGAAATGSLCVGGWVLRGDPAAGMSASQGASPSTLWGEDVLAAMRDGSPAKSAVAQVTGADRGRDFRQLSALDLNGGTGVFTGIENGAERGAREFDGGVAAGNLLTGTAVLEAMINRFAETRGRFAHRLVEALAAAEGAGGDNRGLLSAALLIYQPGSPPLTLRIDHHESDPIGALAALLERAESGDYAAWTRQVPTRNDPERVLDPPTDRLGPSSRSSRPAG